MTKTFKEQMPNNYSSRFFKQYPFSEEEMIDMFGYGYDEYFEETPQGDN